VALQHNLGLGGAVVINVYKRADGKSNRKMSDQEIVRTSAFDYNPAVKAKTPSLADIDKVRSRTARSEYALGDTQKKLQARL
jgi:sterol carrier protein 2